MHVLHERHFNRGDYGNMVTIDHGGGVYTRYAHLKSISVNKGAMIKAGNVIGQVGRTGNTKIGTYTLLHFEILLLGNFVDPMDYFHCEMQK